MENISKALSARYYFNTYKMPINIIWISEEGDKVKPRLNPLVAAIEENEKSVHGHGATITLSALEMMGR